MRHKNAGKKLNRTSAHRKALLKNLMKSLILHGGITTTQAKAKILRPVFEKMITYAATTTGTECARFRYLFAELEDKELVYRFCALAENFSDRKGGYLRIVKFALPRKGDGAPLVRIELLQ